MNIPKQNWLIDRRHVLRGLGVSLALPWLECMQPIASAHAAAAAPRPRRSVFIYLPNGVNTIDYQITEAGENYKFSKSLAPLEKHRAVITPISGLHHPNALGHQHKCRINWLTGAVVDSSVRNTVSVDQLMATVTAPLTRFSSLELATQGGSMAVNSDGVPLPTQSSPAAVFRAMFQPPEDGARSSARPSTAAGAFSTPCWTKPAQLDASLGQADRGRLQQYLTSVREVEIRTQRANSWLDTPYPKIDTRVAAALNRPYSLQQLGEYLRTMYDLIVLAFQTDLTRVATFNSGDESKGPPIPELGITRSRHALSHHNDDPEMMGLLTQTDVFNYAQFAYFLDRLSEVQDADGPLIETTMALYGSGMSYGGHHGNANLPLVLAGGTKLGLKNGRHVDYNRTAGFDGYELENHLKHYRICRQPVSDKARLSNLLLTMAQKMGVETETFSDSLTSASEVEA